MATRLNLSSLQDGDRVYVDGIVMQDTFTTSDDKQRAESSIHPLRIFKSSSLCEGQRGKNHSDMISLVHSKTGFHIFRHQ